MIEMYEGVPGSGKSYHAIEAKFLPWLRSGRRIYLHVDGVYLDKLALFEGVTIEQLEKQITVWRTKSEVLDQLQKVEVGSAVMLDEAQTIFRSREKLDPELLRWLETHRHFGVDVLVMCQNFGQCTSGLLRLVESTTKFRRLDRFGFKNRYQAQVRGNPEETEVIRMYSGKYSPKVYSYYASYSSGAVRETARTNSIWKSPMVIAACLGMIVAGVWFAKGNWLSVAPAPALAKVPSLMSVEIPRKTLKTVYVEQDDFPPVFVEPVRVEGGLVVEDGSEGWLFVSDKGRLLDKYDLLMVDPHANIIMERGVQRVEGENIYWGGAPEEKRMSTGMAAPVDPSLRSVPKADGPAMGGEFFKGNGVDLLGSPPDLR